MVSGRLSQSSASRRLVEARPGDVVAKSGCSSPTETTMTVAPGRYLSYAASLPRGLEKGKPPP